MLAVTLALIVWKRPRLHWVRWLLLARFLGFALFQVRQQAMVAIIAAMLLPQGFAEEAKRTGCADPPMRWVVRGGAALLVAVRAALPLARPTMKPIHGS